MNETNNIDPTMDYRNTNNPNMVRSILLGEIKAANVRIRAHVIHKLPGNLDPLYAELDGLINQLGEWDSRADGLVSELQDIDRLA
jgi:hypothetical protein